ncbi:MAG: hypothetical protein HFG79_02890 [Lachnospiraceae bacterium]|nr:hypothetical protein [Lachnospiraceae bacterium]
MHCCCAGAFPSHTKKYSDPHLNHTDLYIYQCGSECYSNGHFHDPAVRDHFLIHYVHSGKGIFQVGDTTYHLKTGNVF